MPEALAFDLYGTLVDPMRIGRLLQNFLPDDAAQTTQTWRRTQLEYTFRLAAMERHEGFDSVTRKALDHALAMADRTLEEGQKEELMAAYHELETFEDVEAGLGRLLEGGHEMIIFSNGTPRMIEDNMASAGLKPYFRDYVSVDEVGTFKPSPRVYRHAADRLGRPVEEVRLISSNPFDVIGANSVGMQAAWIDRSGGLFDTLGHPPELIVTTLTELADALGK